MAKTLDFNKAKKDHFTVVLNDDNHTRLQIMTPTKRQLEELALLLPEDTSEDPSDEDLKDLYEFVAQLMSRNRQRYTITGAMLEEILDYEDIIIFLDAYSDFIAELSSSKN